MEGKLVDDIIKGFELYNVTGEGTYLTQHHEELERITYFLINQMRINPKDKEDFVQDVIHALYERFINGHKQKKTYEIKKLFMVIRLLILTKLNKKEIETIEYFDSEEYEKETIKYDKARQRGNP